MKIFHILTSFFVVHIFHQLPPYWYFSHYRIIRPVWLLLQPWVRYRPSHQKNLPKLCIITLLCVLIIAVFKRIQTLHISICIHLSLSYFLLSLSFSVTFSLSLTFFSFPHEDLAWLISLLPCVLFFFQIIHFSSEFSLLLSKI